MSWEKSVWKLTQFLNHGNMLVPRSKLSTFQMAHAQSYWLFSVLVVKTDNLCQTSTNFEKNAVMLKLQFFFFKSQGVNVVLVYMHWGTEYSFRPNRRQERIAEYLHSLGVSAVIGAHAHTLLPHSKTKNQLTAYGLGNFLFPQHNTTFSASNP